MDTRANTYPGNYPGNQPGPGHHPERECKEKDTQTGKAIDTARLTYCTNLQTAKGDQASSEKAYDRSVMIYHKKKKLFEWTEHNYRLYRDFDICVDNELTAVTTSLTANVKAISGLSGDLFTNLKSVVTKIADLKTKIGALGDAAYNLDKYKNDQANATQWCLLTGKNVDNCRPEHEHHHHRPEHCHDADQIYHELIHLTKKVLIADVNSLVQSAADTAGIQTFTNIDTLTTQQTAFTTAATALVTQIQTTVTTRRKDLDGVQADLSAAVQACTSAGVDKYTKTSIAHAAHCTVQFLCCPDCECVRIEPCDSHEPRLIDCECRICDIGEKIRSTYRGEGDPDPDCGCHGKEPRR
ncbi:MAG TPA: hypothetical protein VGQ51_00850 [Puia sp.]|nr:hypothetical protein [Puia sp.]